MKKKNAKKQQEPDMTSMFFATTGGFIIIGAVALLSLESFFQISDRWFNYFTVMFASSVAFFGVFLTIISNIGKEKRENYISRYTLRRIRTKIYRKRSV